jgi:hypothetical protein
MKNQEECGRSEPPPPSWQTSPFQKDFQPYCRPVAYDKDGRPWPSLWDICHGCILWLPRLDEIRDKISPGNPLLQMNRGFFDHPVLIVDVRIESAEKGTLNFVKMTS